MMKVIVYYSHDSRTKVYTFRLTLSMIQIVALTKQHLGDRCCLKKLNPSANVDVVASTQ